MYCDWLNAAVTRSRKAGATLESFDGPSKSPARTQSFWSSEFANMPFVNASVVATATTATLAATVSVRLRRYIQLRLRLAAAFMFSRNETALGYLAAGTLPRAFWITESMSSGMSGRTIRIDGTAASA